MGFGSKGTGGKAKTGHAATPSAGNARYRTATTPVESGDAVDWRDVDGSAVHRAVCDVVRAGDAITFSRTRDGGAYSVTILSNGSRYFHREGEASDIEARLLEIAEDAAHLARHDD